MPSRTATTIALFCYLAFMFAITLAPPRHPRSPDHPALNLVPFRTISSFWGKTDFDMVVNVPGNLVAFMPVGAFLPLLVRGRVRWWQSALAGLGLSFVIEALQWSGGRRVADVDDLILNSLGALMGHGLYRAVESLGAIASFRSIREKSRSSTLG